MISGIAKKSALIGHTGKFKISFDFRNNRRLSSTTGLRPLKEFTLCYCRTEFIVMLSLKIFRKEISFYRMRTGEYTKTKILILTK